MRLIEKLEVYGIEHPDTVMITPVNWANILRHARRLELVMPDDCDMMFLQNDQITRIRWHHTGIQILVDDELKITLP